MPVKRTNGQYIWYASEAQKRAVKLCENWYNVKFSGDMGSYTDVCDFLDKYFDKSRKRKELIEKLKSNR